MNLRDTLYNTEQAAAYIGIHPKSLVRSNALIGIHLHDNCRVFLKEELDHYLAQKSQHAHAERWQSNPTLEAEIRARLMTPEQVAEIFGVSVQAIFKNELLTNISIIINKKAVFFDRLQINDLLLKQFIPIQTVPKRGRPPTLPK